MLFKRDLFGDIISLVHGGTRVWRPAATYDDFSADVYSESSYRQLNSPAGPSNSSLNLDAASKLQCNDLMRKRKSDMAFDADINNEDERYTMNGYYDEDGKKFSRFSGDPSMLLMGDMGRQNHSEIEKRRRDKMNTYITELSALIPMCCAMNRKLDKLTVLRMAVQHMKTLKGAADAHSEVSHKPSFLSEEELKHLILRSADGFLFVVSCDRGRILYVSESVKGILHFKQPELIGQSLFDFIHPKDVNKVKEQLLSSDMSPRERFIDAKTMMPVKTELPQKQSQLCSGARRSFFCRMKTGHHKPYTDGSSSLKPKNEVDGETSQRRRKSERKHFSVIHCTGYIKSWSRANMGMEDDNEADCDACDLSCLVAVGLLHPHYAPQSIPDGPHIPLRPTEFCSRNTLDGKFTYVDHRATTVLGYLPQELLGTSVYEYYHSADIAHLSGTHRKVLKSREKIETAPYRFKAKDGSFVTLKTKLYNFTNPWTREVEYLVCTNVVVACQEVSSSGQSADMELSQQMCGGQKTSLQEMVHQEASNSSMRHGSTPQGDWSGGTRPGAGRIGRQIAEEIQKGVSHRGVESTSDSTLTAHQRIEMVKNGQMSPSQAAASISGNPFKVPMTLGRRHLHHTGEPANNLMEHDVFSDSTSDATGDSDEAAMSVVMSLLEADAGLGGPVDFSDIPWPL